MYFVRTMLIAGLLGPCSAGISDTQPAKIAAILALENAPPGVVFEIVMRDKNGLRRALPEVKSAIGKLHSKFPKLPIAVVTHGNEMFALQNSQLKKNPDVTAQTQALVKEGIPVHVCGTYAAMKGLGDEDFPAFVNVAASGPTQIQDYIALGYLHIKITLAPH